MKSASPIVYLVDDEPAVLKALSRLMRSADLLAQTFNSPRDFLEEHNPEVHGCVVLDLAMPGFNGLQLQEELIQRGSLLPIIFLTGHGDVHTGVKAMRDGAVDFLTKPVSDNDLLAAIHRALERNRNIMQLNAARAQILERLAKLTPREHEVMIHVVAGKQNKQIASDLGTVEKTIKVHRARIMEKVQVESIADLVRLTEKAGIAPAQ